MQLKVRTEKTPSWRKVIDFHVDDITAVMQAAEVLAVKGCDADDDADVQLRITNDHNTLICDWDAEHGWIKHVPFETT